jgi:hypothetical protein
VTNGATETTRVVDAETTSTTLDPLAIAATRVQVAMSEIALGLATTGLEDAEEAMFAWTDLSSDLSSALVDLQRDAASLDVAGMKARIENFDVRFDVASIPEWDGFVESFDLFVEELNAVSSQ